MQVKRSYRRRFVLISVVLGSILLVGGSPSGALEIAVTSPLPDATVPAGVLLVRGTVQASGEVGVSVNGRAALTSGSQWAAEVPVDAETVSIVAVATTMDGGSANATVAIAVSPVIAQPLLLRAMPADGIVPLVVTWAITNQTGYSIQQYELDATGTGTFAAPVATLREVETSYASPGLFFPTVRVTDQQSTIYTATTVVLADDPTAVTNRFQGLWAAFKARLQAGDVAGAMAFLSVTIQPRMQAVFQELGSALPMVADGLGQLDVTDQAGSLAEAVLVQEEPEGASLYFIHFRRDSLGRWLIDEM
jgi:hypothetical protein